MHAAPEIGGSVLGSVRLSGEGEKRTLAVWPGNRRQLERRGIEAPSGQARVCKRGRNVIGEMERACGEQEP